MRDRAMLTFVLSHACPLKCDFCCSNREVVGPGRISRDMMADCLIGFGRLPAVERVAFMGGDPCLFLEDICAAVVTARRAGVTQPFQIVTSAYWAKSPDLALNTLDRLRQLGLDLIGLSYDREHARWVTPQQIRDVCDAAAQLKVRVNLTGVFWDEGDRVETLPPTSRPPRERQGGEHARRADRRRAKAGTWPSQSAVPVSRKPPAASPATTAFHLPGRRRISLLLRGFQIEDGSRAGNVHADPPARILSPRAQIFTSGSSRSSRGACVRLVAARGA